MGLRIDRTNIDNYYETVNKKIDHYFEKNVSPKSLFNYFSKDYGLKKFIKREGLEEVENIKKVIMDVVEDRMALDENIKTFDQYNNEPSTFGVIFDIDKNIQKKIADIYRVSLGHIDNKRNRIKLKGVKREKEIFVFTISNINEVFKTIADNMYNVFLNEKDFEYAPLGIKMDLSKSNIDKEKFVNSLYNNIYGKLELVEELLYMETGEFYKFKKTNDDSILIFEKV